MSTEITPSEPGRLDRIVVELQDVGSRSRARRVIEQGKVTVDGDVVTDPGASVESGSVVAIDWNRAGTARKKVAARKGLRSAGLAILYEDDRLIALDKPSGLLTDTATREQARTRDSLRKRVRKYLKARGSDAFVVHRIDRDTTGVVLVAKDAEAAEHLRAQFRARAPVRVYDVVVYGIVAEDAAEWVDVMAWDRGLRIQKPVPDDHPDAFRASANMRVIQRGKGATYLQVSLVTGRRNQIRLQCMLRDHPLVGERLYVRDDWRRPKGPRFDRQALHARSLEIVHPQTGEPLRIEARWPQQFRRLVESL